MSTLSLDDWFETPLGQYLLEREQDYFDQAVADIFGFNALQLGLPQFDLLRTNRMSLRFAAAPAFPEKCHQPAVKLLTDLNQLPLASQSIDLALLPHVLEFHQYPHQILREVERVLMPEGHVIISGFNPLSLWGVPRFLPYRKEEYPWRGHFISLLRIKDWLALLGFEVMAGRLCCYAPPFRREKWRRRFGFMEEAGDRWWALGGGVYFLQARKRIQGMRLVMPGWGERLAAKKALAPAAQKTMKHAQKESHL